MKNNCIVIFYVVTKDGSYVVRKNYDFESPVEERIFFLSTNSQMRESKLTRSIFSRIGKVDYYGDVLNTDEKSKPLTEISLKDICWEQDYPHEDFSVFRNELENHGWEFKKVIDR